MSLILLHEAFPIIEIWVLFLALAYTLNLRLTLKTTFVCISFIILPSIILLLIGVQFIFVAYITISSLLVFSYFIKSLRAFLDLCSLAFGGIISEQVAYRISILFSSEQAEQSYIYYSLILISFVIFSFFYKKFMTKMYPTIDFSSTAKYIIIFTSSLTIILMYLNILLPVFDSKLSIFKLNLLIELIYLSCIFVLYRTSNKAFMMKNELKRLEIENQYSIHYMHSLEKINKEMQKFQHDYANILLTIRGYLEIEDLQGLKQYFQSHILKAEQKTFFKNEVFRNLDHLKIVELKGLLATKVIHADQLGIRLNVEIPETIETIDMDIIDLTRIIGILSDNAIEACGNHGDGQINIAFIKTNYNTILIGIDNTVNNFTLDLDDIYKENFTTKGKNRGLGLTNVKEILKRYDTVNLNTQVEDGWFMQELEIPIRELALSS